MPRIINTKTTKYLNSYYKIKAKNINYDYPNGLNLKPGSELHDKLRDLVIERANASNDAISARRPYWKKIERTLTSYIPLDDLEKKTKDDDERRPIRVVVPISYATLETLLTYWVAAFLRDPIFQYEGYDRYDVAGAMLLERTIQQNAVLSGMGLALHTWWRDGLSAGFGAATPVWTKTEETMVIRKKVEGGNILSRAASKFIKLEPQFEEIEVPAWEGDVLYNIDYRNFLPDPNVPVYNTQDSQGAGWIERSDYITLLEREYAQPDMIFNVKYLKGEIAESALFDTEGSSGRSEGLGGSNQESSLVHNVIDTIYMYLKIIPSDYGLSDSDRPEVWLLALSGDKVITQCRKIENNHGKIPIVVNAPDYDGHTLLPISRMEIIYGLQVAMDWLFDSHMANVRKAINDMLIVDPSLINMYDLKKPGPGKLIRLRKGVWGRGVKDAVMQLPVNDVTRQHIGDSSFILDIIQRVSAASDGVQGIIRRGSERRSAAEFQGTMSSALSRIEKTARITWLQGMLPLQRMLAEDTKQYMSRETFVRLNGDMARMLTKTLGEDVVFESAPGKFRAAVTPESIAYNYDIIPHDGSIPGAGDAQTWTQIFQIASQSPVLAQRIDMFRLFKHIAQLSGAKNVEDFEASPGQLPALQPQVQPDQQVQQQAQAGNYVPVNIGG